MQDFHFVSTGRVGDRISSLVAFRLLLAVALVGSCVRV